MELARNRAVADVVLLSGDEDVRIGVQLAQSFGMRVHLLRIKPCAGTQSAQLRQEADTCSEWGLPIIGKMLSLRPSPAGSIPVSPAVESTIARAADSAPPKASDACDRPAMNTIVERLLGELAPEELKGAAAYMLANRNSVRPELDGRLLACCRTVLGNNLDDASRRHVRSRARQRIREIAADAASL